jgi:hypothetical protein
VYRYILSVDLGMTDSLDWLCIIIYIAHRSCVSRCFWEGVNWKYWLLVYFFFQILVILAFSFSLLLPVVCSLVLPPCLPPGCDAHAPCATVLAFLTVVHDRLLFSWLRTDWLAYHMTFIGLRIHLTFGKLPASLISKNLGKTHTSSWMCPVLPSAPLPSTRQRPQSVSQSVSQSVDREEEI